MREDKGRLQDILEAIEKIEQYAGQGRQPFDGDEMLQVWTEPLTSSVFETIPRSARPTGKGLESQAG